MMRMYQFINGPWENSELPTIVKENPDGGDPHILATIKRVHNPDGLYELCRRADLVEQMAAALRELTEAKALSGVRQQVAGWNGEGRDEPHKERHPSRLGATLPKTNCGAVYELDEAMQRANAILQAYEAAQPAKQAEARASEESGARHD